MVTGFALRTSMWSNSFIHSTSLSGPLTFLRADPDREFTAANAVPVLSKIASSLTHGLPDDALQRWRMQMCTARGQPSAISTEAAELLAVAAKEDERPMRADLPLLAAVGCGHDIDGNHVHHAESSRLINADADSVLRRVPPSSGDTNRELGGVSVSTDDLEAGRKRLRMLVASKKRTAEARLGNE